MHPYLPHLLQDIRKAHRNIPSPGATEAPGTDEHDGHLREIDHWISGDAEHTLGYYCGLRPEDFPPGLQFAEGEIQRVCQAFEKMLVSWEIHKKDVSGIYQFYIYLYICLINLNNISNYVRLSVRLPKPSR
jgi:hypothetical protein